MSEQKQESHIPHDAFFKKTLGHPEAAKHFLLRFMPEAVTSQLDFDSLVSMSTEFIDDKLKNSRADILLSFNTKTNKTAYVYFLLEHQRNPDPILPYRLLKYSIQIADKHIKNAENKNELPLVCPMVIYNGDRPYQYSMSLWDLFSPHNKELAKQTFIEPFLLLDLTQFDTRTLKDDSWIGLTLTALKLAPAQLPPKELVFELKMSMKELVVRREFGYICNVYYYLCAIYPKKHHNQLKQELDNCLKEITGDQLMYSVADYWIDQGMQQGMQQGVQQGMQQGILRGSKQAQAQLIQTLARNGMHVAEIAKMSELTPAEVKALLAVKISEESTH